MRLAYQQGPSRATQLDVKRSQKVIESEQDTPLTSSSTQLTSKISTKTQSSHKQSSPLQNSVVGAKRKSKLNKKEDKSKQGHLELLLDLIHRYSLQHRKFPPLRTQLHKRYQLIILIRN